MDGYRKSAKFSIVTFKVCVQVESRNDPEFSLDLRLKFWKFIKEDSRYVYGSKETLLFCYCKDMS